MELRGNKLIPNSSLIDSFPSVHLSMSGPSCEFFFGITLRIYPKFASRLSLIALNPCLAYVTTSLASVVPCPFFFSITNFPYNSQKAFQTADQIMLLPYFTTLQCILFVIKIQTPFHGLQGIHSPVLICCPHPLCFNYTDSSLASFSSFFLFSLLSFPLSFLFFLPYLFLLFVQLVLVPTMCQIGANDTAVVHIKIPALRGLLHCVEVDRK